MQLAVLPTLRLLAAVFSLASSTAYLLRVPQVPLVIA